ncbi:hypothetical protein [Muninn virus]|nr:hypothetical protein [Muninn virus]
MKYQVIVLKKLNNLFEIVKSVRIKPTVDRVKLPGKTLVVDTSKPTLIKGKKRIYLIDYDTNTQFQLDSVEKDAVTMELVNQVVGKSAVRQLISVASGITFSVISIILGLAIGLPIGLLIGGYLL